MYRDDANNKEQGIAMKPTESCKTCKWHTLVENGKCEVGQVRKCVKLVEIKCCTCDLRLLLSRGCCCGGK